MKSRDSIFLLLGYATMFALFVAFCTLDAALQAWASWTLICSVTMITAAIPPIIRDYSRSRKLRESIAANYDSDAIGSTIVLPISVTLNQLYPFMIPSVLLVVGGIIIGLATGLKRPSGSQMRESRN